MRGPWITARPGARQSPAAVLSHNPPQRKIVPGTEQTARLRRERGLPREPRSSNPWIHKANEAAKPWFALQMKDTARISHQT